MTDEDDANYDGTLAGHGIQPVPCELCGQPTLATMTKRCDRCWELETRIYRDPELARKILRELGARLERGQDLIL